MSLSRVPPVFPDVMKSSLRNTSASDHALVYSLTGEACGVVTERPNFPDEYEIVIQCRCSDCGSDTVPGSRTWITVSVTCHAEYFQVNACSHHTGLGLGDIPKPLEKFEALLHTVVERVTTMCYEFEFGCWKCGKQHDASLHPISGKGFSWRYSPLPKPSIIRPCSHHEEWTWPFEVRWAFHLYKNFKYRQEGKKQLPFQFAVGTQNVAEDLVHEFRGAGDGWGHVALRWAKGRYDLREAPDRVRQDWLAAFQHLEAGTE